MLGLKKLFKYIFIGFILFLPTFFSYAQENDVSKKNAQIYISPRTGSFLNGSIFEVGIYLDTRGSSINTVDLKVNFDPRKLSVARPSGGKSIFGIWVDAPTYDNTNGLIHMSGTIPDGIVTSSGLITTISFKVIATGETSISINNNTAAYLNDGSGTKVNLAFGRSELTLRNPVGEGVSISSETHPFSDNWYNNNNPIFTWENFKESKGYAVLLDTNPSTVPENKIATEKNTFSYNSIDDGIWYFHIKSSQGDGWGNSSHFKIKIDTHPPEKFKPTINKFTGDGKSDYLLMFNTTDLLSGLDHYEVGILKNKRDINTLPVFVQAESPYVLPTDGKENIKVIVKAFDTAGNVTEVTASLYPNKTKIYVICIGILILLLLILHYVFGHHIGRNLKRAYEFFRDLSKNDDSNLDGVPRPM